MTSGYRVEFFGGPFDGRIQIFTHAGPKIEFAKPPRLSAASVEPSPDEPIKLRRIVYRYDGRTKDFFYRYRYQGERT